MDRLVECVPNFSEGRNTETIESLAHAIESVQGAVVLDIHMDADHNRSVITFVADASVVVDAAIKAVALAAKLIDLRMHTGEHPRLGATDVLPFIPVSGVTMEECVAIAHTAGERIATELDIPVYFYERAALQTYRVRLEDVRRGGFETLRSEIEKVAERAPDVGPRRLHPNAGAIVVGARPFLIAYNINLRTEDVGIARKIAKAVRGRDGGLLHLKALGFKLLSRSLAQVSMNLVDYEKTRLHHAFEAVRREADRYGVQIAGSEIVGLVPQAALDQSAEYFLQLDNFSPGIVLENRIAAAIEGKSDGRSTADFVADVAAGTPVPGGGAVAAHAASLGAALGEMIAHLTEGRDKYKDVEGDVGDALSLLSSLRVRLGEAVNEDVESFERVLKARKAEKSGGAEKRETAGRLEEALKGAALVPLEVAGIAVQVLELLETLAEIGNTNGLSDAATGAQVSLAAVAAARYNVFVNTSEIDDEEFVVEHRSRADDFLDRAREIASRVESLLMDSLS